MISMGYGYTSAIAPSGVDVGFTLGSFIFLIAAVSLGYLVANKFGYTKYMSLIIAGIGFVFYLLSGVPDTAVILVLGLFGVGQLLTSHGFILNPTLLTPPVVIS